MKKDGKRWKKMEGKSVHQRIENGLSLPLSLVSLSFLSFFVVRSVRRKYYTDLCGLRKTI